MQHNISENKLILILGLIIFMVIVDFMMVMPLGPDFAIALGISTHNIGLIAGSYTLAAAVTGLLASFVIDRFDRRKAILFCFTGLIIATAVAALSWDINSMVAARLLAGMFGGPLHALGNAMITDVVPAHRRGAAMGKFAGAFAAASVLGVPFGLELASRFSWHTPFVALSICGVIISFFAWRYLPHHSNQLQKLPFKRSLVRFITNLKSRDTITSYAFMCCIVFSAFMMIPNISSHVHMNMGYPRADLGILYFFGGSVSFFTMRAIGRIVDTKGATYASIIGTSLFIFALLSGFIFYNHGVVPVLVIFVIFMVGTTTRYVSGQTLSSKVPPPTERGSYNAVQNSLISLFQTIGAFLSSRVLVDMPDGTLAGVPVIASIALVVSLFVPVLFYITEKSVKTRLTNSQS